MIFIMAAGCLMLIVIAVGVFVKTDTPFWLKGLFALAAICTNIYGAREIAHELCDVKNHDD